LSATGWSQLDDAIAANKPADRPWQAIYSSPLQRCRLPAQRLAERLGLPLHVDSRLRELDFGAWDGQPYQRVWQHSQSLVEAFWRDPEAHPPPAGESLQTMRQRLDEMLQLWLVDLNMESVRDTDEHRLLCVTHGGVIRTLLCRLLGLPLASGQQLSLDYASVTRIELYPAQSNTEPPDYYSQLIFINRLPELGGYV
jgi:alpha-ribazole phosphatase